MDEPDDRRWLAALAVGVGTLSVVVVLPYLQFVLAAVVLAYVLYPLQRRLEPRAGRTATAAALLVVATVAILAPLAVVLLVAADQAVELARAIDAGDLEIEVFEQRLAEFGLEVDVVALYGELQGPIETAARGLADQALAVAGGLPGFLIGLTVSLFVLYSLLRDGDRLVRWIGTILPLSRATRTELFSRVDRLLYVAIVANVAVAGVQALLTTIGLALVGIPSLVFFFIVTFVLSLLPLIGASLVWAPVSIYLIVVGRPVAGVALFAYGAVIVSLSDNALRPIAVGRGASMSVATVIVGIFGGVAVAGVMGLFFGPVVLGTFKTVAELYAHGPARSAESQEATGSAAVDAEAGEGEEDPDDEREKGEDDREGSEAPGREGDGSAGGNGQGSEDPGREGKEAPDDEREEGLEPGDGHVPGGGRSAGDGR